MNILSFDTSTDMLRAGLKTDSGWFENIRSTGLKHGESLIPMVSTILDESELKPSDIDLIVCTKGPGSFTGLRIGLSTAKGLSEGADIPLVTVSTLEIYGSLYTFFPGTVVPLLDAKKNNFYTCFYKNGNSLTDEMDIPAEEVVNKALNAGLVLFTGPGLEIFLKRVPLVNENNNFVIDHFVKKSFCNIMSVLGEKKFLSIGPEPPEAGPSYLRASDAELGK